MGDSYRARFWSPSASTVAIVGDRCHLDLTTSDGEHWEAEVLFPQGVHRYRFLIDGSWTAPDPFNARYTIVDGQYYSVFENAKCVQDRFPEVALRMFMSSEEPSQGQTISERVCFGPAHRRITAVLQCQGLWREENHVSWLWKSPSGRKLVLSDLVFSAHELLYCAIPYEDFREFGAWTVSGYINGRCQGVTAFAVRPAVYGRDLRPVSSRVSYQVG